jgi:hypothetical protein
LIKNKVSKILIHVAIFVSIIYIADRLIGNALKNLYFRQSSSPDYLLTYSLTSCKEDLIILGNSRAQHHYIPSILTDSLGMSCFNAGQDGGHSVFLPYAQTLAILNRYTPKIIILEFSPSSIFFDQESYDKMSILLPYYDTIPILKQLIESRSDFEKIKLYSKIYPYNSNIINIIRFNIINNTLRDSFDKGYSPIFKSIKNDLPISTVNIRAGLNELDRNKLEAFENLIKCCNDSGTKLIVINSPIFKNNTELDNLTTPEYKIVKLIVERNNIPFFDYSSDSTLVSNREYFADIKHLNDSGAIRYSELIASNLVKLINYNHQYSNNKFRSREF